MPGTAFSPLLFLARLAAWWREPRLNGWVWAALAGLVLLLEIGRGLLRPRSP